MEMVSVIMGTYNPSDKIFKSVESILNQSYTNFEFIIYNDGSTNPQSQSYIQQIAKLSNKIVLIQSEQNQGLAFALNQCIKAANTDLLIRMDDDDISHPNRIEKLVSYASKYPEMAVIGTWANLIDETGGVWGSLRTLKFPTLIDVYYGKSFIHPSVLMRKSKLEIVGYYSINKKNLRLEDYDLWIRLYLSGLEGMNIEESLLEYYEDKNSLKKRNKTFRIREFRLRIQYMKYVGVTIKTLIYSLKPLILIVIPSEVYKIVRRISKSEVM